MNFKFFRICKFIYILGIISLLEITTLKSVEQNKQYGFIEIFNDCSKLPSAINLNECTYLIDYKAYNYNKNFGLLNRMINDIKLEPDKISTFESAGNIDILFVFIKDLAGKPIWTLYFEGFKDRNIFIDIKNQIKNNKIYRTIIPYSPSFFSFSKKSRNGNTFIGNVNKFDILKSLKNEKEVNELINKLQKRQEEWQEQHLTEIYMGGD